jgi:hypothetical protein
VAEMVVGRGAPCGTVRSVLQCMQAVLQLHTPGTSSICCGECLLRMALSSTWARCALRVLVFHSLGTATTAHNSITWGNQTLPNHAAMGIIGSHCRTWRTRNRPPLPPPVNSGEPAPLHATAGNSEAGTGELTTWVQRRVPVPETLPAFSAEM